MDAGTDISRAYRAGGQHQPRQLDRARNPIHSPTDTRTRCIFFHHVRNPREMAEPEINAFLTHLTVKEKVSASTQNQALCALLFIYRHVLNRGPAGVRSPVDGSGDSGGVLTRIRIRCHGKLRRERSPRISPRL